MSEVAIFSSGSVYKEIVQSAKDVEEKEGYTNLVGLFFLSFFFLFYFLIQQSPARYLTELQRHAMYNTNRPKRFWPIRQPF